MCVIPAAAAAFGGRTGKTIAGGLTGGLTGALIGNRLGRKKKAIDPTAGVVAQRNGEAEAAAAKRGY